MLKHWYDNSFSTSDQNTDRGDFNINASKKLLYSVELENIRRQI